MREAPHIPELAADPSSVFPDPEQCHHPDGLLAWGGDLSPVRLMGAYREGIFPWYEPGSPILWWSPDPRAVFVPYRHSLPRRLLRTLRHSGWRVTVDGDFNAVISACAETREAREGTWITPAMKAAYLDLHLLGMAHSIEVWFEEDLVGGLYGVSLGRVFFAESKFHRRTDASKIALAYLMALMKRWSFLLVDCQIPNPHLMRMGAEMMPRHVFRQAIRSGLATDPTHPHQQPGRWVHDCPNLHHLEWPVRSIKNANQSPCQRSN